MTTEHESHGYTWRWVLAVLTFAALLVLGACGGDGEDTDGIALIDDLIACSGPDWWDREGLIEDLEEDEDATIEFVKERLEQCRTLKSLAESETATPVPTPRSEFSTDALTLLALYHELQRFKDEPWFHQYCYAVASPAHDWGKYATTVEMDIEVFIETGIGGPDLWSMGFEYCDSQGNETDETRWIREQMSSDWLNYKPVPTPKPEFTVPR